MSELDQLIAAERKGVSISAETRAANLTAVHAMIRAGDAPPGPSEAQGLGPTAGASALGPKILGSIVGGGLVVGMLAWGGWALQSGNGGRVDPTEAPRGMPASVRHSSDAHHADDAASNVAEHPLRAPATAPISDAARPAVKRAAQKPQSDGLESALSPASHERVHHGSARVRSRVRPKRARLPESVAAARLETRNHLPAALPQTAVKGRGGPRPSSPCHLRRRLCLVHSPIACKLRFNPVHPARPQLHSVAASTPK